jgi:hypothetical protein
VSRELVRKALASSVIAYLKQHPQAMDTVRGIAEWWVPPGGAPIDLTEMREVLEELRRRGVLEQIDAGEHTHYRLKKG